MDHEREATYLRDLIKPIYKWTPAKAPPETVQTYKNSTIVCEQSKPVLVALDGGKLCVCMYIHNHHLKKGSHTYEWVELKAGYNEGPEVHPTYWLNCLQEQSNV